MVNNENTYNSLEDIQGRREALAKEIDASEDKIADLWQTLFAKEEAPRYETPSKRLQRLMSSECLTQRSWDGNCTASSAASP